jgi:ParB family chromosome partitioning protein|tara:strand:- start:1027 stop:1890 length:864 start_codon:yes stop_codon:yes gene_type:complete
MSGSRKKGLGRGLSALFGDQVQEVSEKTVETMGQKKALIADLIRNKYQPRINFDEDKLNELASSIKKNGVIQPIAVRADKTDPGRYEIIAGERRLLAAQKAGLHEVPIMVLDLSDSESLEVAIVENIQRENLNIVEEAKAYERLNSEFSYDHDKISKLMSKSRSHVSNTLRLLNLPKDVISMLEEGEISAGQARPLIGLSNASSIAEEIVSRKLSSRQVEILTKKTRNISKKNQQNNSDILNEEKKLEEILGLKVNIINKKNNSGKITIEYKDLDQFSLISNLLKKS